MAGQEETFHATPAGSPITPTTDPKHIVSRPTPYGGHASSGSDGS
ncbi:MAG: hypothetical protein QOF70_7160, partial [Acetobacteraceae bacterium]|nr:hypothetical protein [Acetobacteraceae bacterium]